MRQWLIFAVFTISNSWNLWSQDISELKSQLKETSNFQEQISILNQLINRIGSSDPSQALEFSQQALEIADINDYALGKAEIYLIRGDLFYENLQSEDALFYYAQSLSLYKQLDKSPGIAQTSLHIAKAYNDFDDYIKALEYSQEAEKIYKDLDNDKELADVLALTCEIYYSMGENGKALPSCYEALRIYEKVEYNKGRSEIHNSLGLINLDLKNHQRARTHFFQSLEIAKQINDTEKIATSLSTIGDMYLSKKNYAQALDYFNQALDLHSQLNDLGGLGFTYLKIGEILSKNDENNRSLEVLNTSLNYAQELNDLDLQARALSQIGKVYSNMGDYKKGIDFLKQSLLLALRINARPILQTCYQNLAIYYDKLGDSENAFVYFNLYMRQNEAIYTKESAKKIAEAQALYDFETKEKQIELLRKENEIQNLQANTRRLVNYSLIAGLFAVIIIVIGIYNRYRIKIKANYKLEQKNTAIEQQKKEIEQHRDDIQEKSTAIAEFNSQLTDSIRYAKRIQESLLPENKELRHIFPDSFIFYKPKDIVSGDFYWFNEVDHKTVIATVDCTGHGVPGAFMTVLANSLLNQIVLESKITDPNLVITLLDQKVQQNLHQNQINSSTTDGMDIALCTIDKTNFETQFTGAKLPLYYVHKEQLTQIKGDRFSVGSSQFKDKFFTSKKIKLKKGDTLYFCSDGFQDQFGGENNKKFMKTQFREMLCSLHRFSMEEQFNRINKIYYDWKGGTPQTDDILVVGIRL